MACDITSAFLKGHVIEKIKTVVGKRLKITHSKLTEEVDTYLSDPNCLEKINAPPEAQSDRVDWAYSPIFQSGGKDNLEVIRASSNDSELQFGPILCSVGIRYNNYCSNISRTYLVQPTKDQEEIYELLIQAQQAAINTLKEGVPLKHVYNAALKIVNSEKPDLQRNFTKNCGFRVSTFPAFLEYSKLIHTICFCRSVSSSRSQA